MASVSSLEPRSREVLGQVSDVTTMTPRSDSEAGVRPTRTRLMSLLVQPTAPPLWLGAVVAAVFIVVETILVRLLMGVAPGNTFGVVYLLGVLVVSARWGFGLSAMTTLASTLAYGYVHFVAEGSFLPTEVKGWVAILIFAAHRGIGECGSRPGTNAHR